VTVSGKRRGKRISSEYEAYSEIIAAGLIIKIVDERPFFAVIKEDPYHAEPSRQRGMFLFNYFSPAPEGKTPVFDNVSHP
jgi:hypothetical protein